MEAPEDEKPAGIGRLPRRLLDWLRNWRLRSWRTALLGLWIAWLIVGVLVIPLIVRNLLIENLRKQAGLEATVRSVRFNPFTLSLTIEGLSIPDRRGSVLFSADEIYANAELSSLFRWAATLSEFRMVNPVIGARRFADGRINLAEVVEEVRRRQPPRARPPNPKSSLPRVLLQHIKISGATINVEDQARAKPLKMAFGPSVFELSEITTIPERQGTKEIAIRLPGSGVVRATGSVTVQPLGLEGDVRLEELHLKELWPLLEPYFQFTVESGELTGRFHYTIAAADGKVRARITDFENALKDLTVVNEGDRVLEVPAAAITKGSFRWPEAELVVERLRLERPSVLVQRDADGKMSWERMVPQPTREVVTQTYQEIEKAAPWTVAVGRFEVVGSHGRFVDRTLNPPVSLDAGDVQMAITGFTTRPGAFFGVEFSSSLPKGGTTKSSGRFSMKPVQFEADVALDGLDLTVAQPYLGRLFPFEILSGRAGSKGKVAGGVDGEEGLLGEVRRRSGCPDDGAARDGHGLDASEVGCRAGPGRRGRIQPDERQRRGQVGRRSRRANRPGHLGERRAQCSRGQEKDGRELIARFATASRIVDGAPAPAPGPTQGNPIPIRVDSFALADCSIALTDHRLRPPYTVAVDRIQGTVKGIATSSSTSTSTGAPARIEIGAALRGGGEVTLKGAMDLFQPGRATDLQLGLQRIEIPPMSPMSVHYVGYPVTKGRSDLSLDYKIKDQQLKGSNHIATKDLTLGDKVAGERKVNLPIKLGVSLLTDKDGRITLDFPVEGRLDDPKFGVGSAIGGAIGERRFRAGQVSVPSARENRRRKRGRGSRPRRVSGRERGARPGLRRAPPDPGDRPEGAPGTTDRGAGRLGRCRRRDGAAGGGTRETARILCIGVGSRVDLPGDRDARRSRGPASRTGEARRRR